MPIVVCWYRTRGRVPRGSSTETSLALYRDGEQLLWGLYTQSGLGTAIALSMGSALEM
jgi:hypothetical protein